MVDTRTAAETRMETPCAIHCDCRGRNTHYNWKKGGRRHFPLKDGREGFSHYRF